MSAGPDVVAPPGTRRLSRGEFIALMGMIFATVAFSIDAMLPALPDIAAELSPEDANRAQLILTSFVLGMGLGTLLAGPLSDALGRRRVIFLGAGLYVLGACLALVAPTLETLLAARILQGIGAAGPRVVSLAMVRDLYSGRAMAQIVSYAMLIFTLFPAVAPLIGAAIIAGFGWRAIFVAFLVFSVVSIGWLGLRQPETLPPPVRRPLAPRRLLADAREALSHRQMQFSIAVQTLIFTALFGVISSIQQVFDTTYGMAESFPLWFAAIALLAAPAAPVNGVLVMRLGMRALIRQGLLGAAAAAFLAALVLTILGPGAGFAVFFLWSVTVFATAAFTIGNLNALALEPLGHIAGTAASLMGALATVGGAVGGAIIGQFFSGTAVPVALGVGIALSLGAAIMVWMPREAVDG